MNVDRHDIREYIGVDPEIETIGIVSNVLPREKLDRLRRDTRTTTRNALHQEKLGRPRRDTRVTMRNVLHREKLDRLRHHEKRSSPREIRPSTSGRSDHYEKNASSREVRPSISAYLDSLENDTKEDAEIISVRGPLARGWCQVDEEEPTASSSDPGSTSKAVCDDDPMAKNTSGTVNPDSARRRSHLNDGNGDKPDGPSRYSKTSSPSKRKDSRTSSPLSTKDGSSTFGSPRRRDHESNRDSEQSTKRRSKSPQRKSSNNQQQRNGTAMGVKEKIPSLLDMCVNGLDTKRPSTPISLFDTIRDSSQFANDSLQGERCTVNGKESDRNGTKSRSLLDMDIPPPDRNVMRRYAIVLNSYELTKRRINVRSGSHKQDLPSRSPLKSPPRRNDRYDRRPRSYIHGIRN
ncbi:hypothetical protein COOONC_26515 [Cooperia oncophora]